MHSQTRTRKPDSAAAVASYLRYLKPGALARLRDSRISARTHRTLTSQIHICSSIRSADSVAQAAQIDVFPLSPVRIRGPRCPQRKKLVAAKAVLFAVPGLDSPAPPPIESVGDLFGSGDSALIGVV